jgi:hypothetical protein
MASEGEKKPWVWAVFAFNMLFGGIFAILSWATFSVGTLDSINVAEVFR